MRYQQGISLPIFFLFHVLNVDIFMPPKYRTTRRAFTTCSEMESSNGATHDPNRKRDEVTTGDICL